eukprot:396824-Prymnesium_polylepis.1
MSRPRRGTATYGTGRDWMGLDGTGWDWVLTVPAKDRDWDRLGLESQLPGRRPGLTETGDLSPRLKIGTEAE